MTRQGIRSLLTSIMLASSLMVSMPLAAEQRIYVRIGPPRAVSERRPVRPGRDYVWITGHQSWRGESYYWMGGRWERPPHARARWQSGRWRHDRHGYFYIEGRWR